MAVWLHGSGHGGEVEIPEVGTSKLQQSTKPLAQDATILASTYIERARSGRYIYRMTADRCGTTEQLVSFWIYGGANTPYQRRMEKQVTGSQASDIYDKPDLVT
jgi:hypothetical protein